MGLSQSSRSKELIKMARVRMGKMITEIKTDAKVKGVCYGILISMR